jgi:hypothetical protein
VPPRGAQHGAGNRVEFGFAARGDVAPHRGAELGVCIVEFGQQGGRVDPGAVGVRDRGRLGDAGL